MVDTHLPKVDPTLIDDLLVRELDKKSDETSTDVASLSVV
jgi:hypothetical protein